MPDVPVELPVRPPTRLERLLWLIAGLLGWAFLEAARAVVARGAGHVGPSSGSAQAWLVIPALAAAFEGWLLVTALRLRRRRGRRERVVFSGESVSFPPLGLRHRPRTLRYDAVVSVTRRGFGGGARVVIRHRAGTLSVPVAQVADVELLPELARRLPGVVVPVVEAERATPPARGPGGA